MLGKGLPGPLHHILGLPTDGLYQVDHDEGLHHVREGGGEQRGLGGAHAVSDEPNPGEAEVVEDTAGVAETLQEVIHLAAAQVGAEAVARVVQAEQGEVGTPGDQEGRQTVKGGRIVQPAVQTQDRFARRISPTFAWKYSILYRPITC